MLLSAHIYGNGGLLVGGLKWQVWYPGYVLFVKIIFPSLLITK